MKGWSQWQPITTASSNRIAMPRAGKFSGRSCLPFPQSQRWTIAQARPRGCSGPHCCDELLIFML